MKRGGGGGYAQSMEQHRRQRSYEEHLQAERGRDGGGEVLTAASTGSTGAWAVSGLTTGGERGAVACSGADATGGPDNDVTDGQPADADGYAAFALPVAVVTSGSRSSDWTASAGPAIGAVRPMVHRGEI